MTGEDELARVRHLDHTLKEEGPREPDEGVPDNLVPLQPPTDAGSGLSPEMIVTFGQHMNPQPFNYVVTVGSMNGKRALFLTFEYAHGRITFPLSDLEAQGLANRLTQLARGGIVVAKDLPPT